MKQVMPYLGIGGLIVLTLIGGQIQGKLSNRWGMPEDMDEGVARLDELKAKLQAEGFGPRNEWKLVKTAPMTELVQRTLECTNYINGAFVNSITKEEVNGFIVLGPPGPISVHTPEVCYDSRAYKKKESRQPQRIFDSESQLDEFWTVTMRREDVDADILRVYWAWATDGQWRTPGNQRLAFGGQSKLFKMQLASTLAADVNVVENDVCRRFLQAFLPVVNATLFPAAAEE